MAAVYTQAALDDALLSQLGEDGDMVAIRTFANDFTPGVGAIPANFVESNYPGYPDGGVVGGWTGPTDAGAGERAMRSPAILYTRAAGGSGETVYGWYVTKEGLTGTIVLAAERYPVPVPMTSEGATLALQLVAIAARG